VRPRFRRPFSLVADPGRQVDVFDVRSLLARRGVDLHDAAVAEVDAARDDRVEDHLASAGEDGRAPLRFPVVGGDQLVPPSSLW